MPGRGRWSPRGRAVVAALVTASLTEPGVLLPRAPASSLFHLLTALALGTLLRIHRPAPLNARLGMLLVDFGFAAVGWLAFVRPVLTSGSPAVADLLAGACPMMDVMLVWVLLRPSKPPGAVSNRARVRIIMAACSIPPVLLAGVSLRSGPLAVREFTIVSVVVATLLMARLWGLSAELGAQARTLEQLSLTDHLTGLPNRRAADARLQQAVDRARSGEAERLTVGLMDLDRFKAYNDAHGHLAGDARLVEFADLWRAQAGPDTFVARFGGEEFLLLSGLNTEEVGELVAGVRDALPGPDTFSTGVAAWHYGDTVADLLSRADQALYRAKDAGRARTVVAPGLIPRPWQTTGWERRTHRAEAL